jgi:HAD superfamily hydrolase (TIGR01509 family)
MIKAMIVDMFGVLLRVSSPLSKRIEARYHVPADEFFADFKEIMKVLRKGGIDDSWQLWKPLLNKFNINLTKDDFFEFWFSDEKLDQELVELIKNLKSKGIKVFILSKSFRERTEYHQKHNPELFNLIDKAYFSWQNGIEKPDPEAWRQILKGNSLEAEDCLYFDDNENNILVAKSLGIVAQVYQGIDTVKELPSSR